MGRRSAVRLACTNWPVARPSGRRRASGPTVRRPARLRVAPGGAEADCGWSGGRAVCGRGRSAAGCDFRGAVRRRVGSRCSAAYVRGASPDSTWTVAGVTGGETAPYAPAAICGPVVARAGAVGCHGPVRGGVVRGFSWVRQARWVPGAGCRCPAGSRGVRVPAVISRTRPYSAENAPGRAGRKGCAHGYGAVRSARLRTHMGRTTGEERSGLPGSRPDGRLSSRSGWTAARSSRPSRRSGRSSASRAPRRARTCTCRRRARASTWPGPCRPWPG